MPQRAVHLHVSSARVDVILVLYSSCHQEPEIRSDPSRVRLTSALLLWSGHRKCAMDAMELFTFRRTQNYDPDAGIDESVIGGLSVESFGKGRLKSFVCESACACARGCVSVRRNSSARTLDVDQGALLYLHSSHLLEILNV